MKMDNEYFDLEDLKNAQKLSYKKRMQLLEDLNNFILKAMPEDAKKISSKLREAGF